MATTVYNRGLDEMTAFTTSTYKVMLLKGTGYTVNRDHDWVSDLVPASNEVTVATYARQTLGGKSRTIDDTLDRITYDCTDPSFGAPNLAAGETVTALVLFRFVTVDGDSPLICYYPISSVATSGIPFPITFDSTGVLYVDQGA